MGGLILPRRPHRSRVYNSAVVPEDDDDDDFLAACHGNEGRAPFPWHMIHWRRVAFGAAIAAMAIAGYGALLWRVLSAN